MRLEQLLEGLPLQQLSAGNPDITNLQVDSRAVGPGSLFMAREGWFIDSHQYIPAAIAAGAVATFGQLCMTRAYGCAPAAWVGSFSYASVPVSALLAWLIWQETLSLRAMLGAALVIGLCVGLSVSAGRRRRRNDWLMDRPRAYERWRNG